MTPPGSKICKRKPTNIATEQLFAGRDEWFYTDTCHATGCIKHNHRYTEVWVTFRYRLACDGDLSAPWTTASSSLHKTHLMWFQRFQFRATRWRPPGTRNRPWPPQFQLRHLTIQDFTRYSPMGYHPPTTTSINAPTLLHRPTPVNNSKHSDVNHVLLY